MELDYDWFVRSLPREHRDLARYLFIPALETLLKTFGTWLEAQDEDRDIQVQCGVERVAKPPALEVVGIQYLRKPQPMARAWIRAVNPEDGTVLFTASMGDGT